jgi:hypothetical protein
LGFHDRALPAAMASMAAHRQGKFWDYHDLLFERKAFEDSDFESMATDLGLNLEQWKADYADPAIEEQVKRQEAACGAVGITGTPGFTVNGRKLSGAKPFEEFQTVIEEELVKARAEIEKGVARADIFEHMIELGQQAPATEAATSALHPVTQRFDLSQAPAMGPAGAPAELVIFSEFQ